MKVFNAYIYPNFVFEAACRTALKAASPEAVFHQMCWVPTVNQGGQETPLTPDDGNAWLDTFEGKTAAVRSWPRSPDGEVVITFDGGNFLGAPVRAVQVFAEFARSVGCPEGRGLRICSDVEGAPFISKASAAELLRTALPHAEISQWLCAPSAGFGSDVPALTTPFVSRPNVVMYGAAAQGQDPTSRAGWRYTATWISYMVEAAKRMGGLSVWIDLPVNAQLAPAPARQILNALATLEAGAEEVLIFQPWDRIGAVATPPNPGVQGVYGGRTYEEMVLQNDEYQLKVTPAALFTAWADARRLADAAGFTSFGSFGDPGFPIDLSACFVPQPFDGFALPPRRVVGSGRIAVATPLNDTHFIFGRAVLPYPNTVISD